MSLINYISPEFIKAHTNSRNKKDILLEISELASQKSENPKQSQIIYKALKQREKTGSTGFENGIAIPHCRLEEIDNFVVGMVVSKDGIDFNSIDGKPSHIFFYIIAPQSKSSTHVRFLANISRILNSRENRSKLLECNNTEQLTLLLKELTLPLGVSEKQSESKSLFYIIIKNECIFTDVLNIIASYPADISVIEASSVESHLYRIPLFSALWNPQVKGFHNIVMGIINCSLINELIRSIDTKLDGIDKRNDILIFSQNIEHHFGSMKN